MNCPMPLEHPLCCYPRDHAGAVRPQQQLPIVLIEAACLEVPVLMIPWQKQMVFSTMWSSPQWLLQPVFDVQICASEAGKSPAQLALGWSS